MADGDPSKTCSRYGERPAGPRGILRGEWRDGDRGELAVAGLDQTGLPEAVTCRLTVVFPWPG